MVNTSSSISQNQIKLHLGCGPVIKEGYLNVDQYFSAPGVQQMDIFALPFAAESIDEIFTEHMLEHLNKYEVPVALQEWARVLKPDGKLVMNLPNLEWCLQQWLAKPESERWGLQLDMIFGLQTHPGEFHKTGFTKPRLMQLLQEAGFTNITIEDYWSHAQGCFWVEASKSETPAEPSYIQPPSSTASLNQALYPPIAPLAASPDRPFWSVMIPVYNPQKDYLEQVLTSVLAQAPAPEQMQIEVVDDGSPNQDVADWVAAIGQGRITYYKQPQNLGLLANWNDCIQRAKGVWVHLLHQDDLVLPGFYDRLQAALEQQKEVGAAFCRYAYIDELGNQGGLSELEQDSSGVLENWLEKIAVGQRTQFVATVVQRSTYETLGGYTPEVGSAADWEMWRRIAAFFPIWYEPEALACFRIHPQSESSRLIKMGQNIADIRRSIKLASTYYPKAHAEQWSQLAMEQYAFSALNLADRMFATQDLTSALALIREGLKCCQSQAIRHYLVDILLNDRSVDTLTIRETYRLRHINWLACPDWSLPEEDLLQSLTSALRLVLTNNNCNLITLLIAANGIDLESADLAVSGALMYLIGEEGIEVEVEPEIVVIDDLETAIQQGLLTQVTARIRLQNDNLSIVSIREIADLPTF